MPSDSTLQPSSPELYRAVVPDLLELCASHRVDTALIESSRDLNELLDQVLEEYGRALAAIRSGDADPALRRGTASRLGALVAFARKVVALDERDETAAELQRRAAEFERLNGEIERALLEADRSTRRVEQVLASFDDRLRTVRRPDPRRARLEKLFQTLGVLAHKINNPLTALMGRAQILQFKKGGDPHVSKAGEVIEDSAKRIASYVRELVQVVRDGRDDLLAGSSDSAAPKPPEQEGQHEGEDQR